jgi:glycosyltransferase involved in cell wall biosynthesis
MRVVLADPPAFTPPYDHELAAALARAGADVTLVTSPFRFGEAPAANGYRRRELFYPLSSRVFGRSLLRVPLKVAEHPLGLARLQATPADVLHVQWLVPELDVRLLRPRVPSVFTAHDLLPRRTASRLDLWRRLLGRFDRVVVHTEQARRRLVDYGVGPDRIVRIAHGFLHDDEPGAIAVPAPADGNRVSFLLFGKIKPYKGADIAIEAMRRMAPDTRERCVLRIVGKPYVDTKPLLRAAAELGPSLVLDFRHVPDRDIPVLWEQADVLLFPYREIEMSGVLMSALTAARPVIASEIGGFTELLENGRTALLVPPNDPEALSAAMRRLAGEPSARREMSQQISALAATIPTWRAIARETAAVYAQAREVRTAQG